MKLFLGAQSFGTSEMGNFFKGVLDEITIWDAALSDAEINEMLGLNAVVP